MKRCRVWAVALGFLLVACGLAAQTRFGGNPPGQTGAPTAGSLMDINRASAEELKTLPGIADAYAAAIIRNRPYRNKTQLNTQKVIPPAAYKKIRALIIARQ
jgi:competence protein ComEA